MQPPRLAPFAVAAALCHGVAALAMLALLRPGLPAPGVELAARMAYVAAYPGRWALGWLCWHAAALSLMGLYGALAWLARGRPALAIAGAAIGSAGLAADLGGQGLALVLQPGADSSLFLVIERAQVAMTAYVANGLYTVAGLVLVVASPLPRGIKLASAPIWLAGLGMSVATLYRSSAGLVVTAALLTAGMVFWPLILAHHLRRTAS